MTATSSFSDHPGAPGSTAQLPVHAAANSFRPALATPVVQHRNAEVHMNPISSASYTTTLTTHSPADDVYYALTQLEAIADWWCATSMTGSGQCGGEFHITFGAEEQPTVMRVLTAHQPRVVVWAVEASPLVSEWVGTRPTFTITSTPNGCLLDFAHHGLTPRLSCFNRCATDWGHFLRRLRSQVRSQGETFRSAC